MSSGPTNASLTARRLVDHRPEYRKGRLRQRSASQRRKGVTPSFFNTTSRSRCIRWLRLFVWSLLATAAGVVLGGTLALLTACAPIVDVDAEVPSTMEPQVSFVPQATDEGLPTIVHLRLSLPDGSPPPTEVRLIQGDVSAQALTQLASGQPSDSLEKRSLPVQLWPIESGDWWVVPTKALRPDTIYTIAIPTPAWTYSFVTRKHEPLPLLELVWPLESDGADEAAVWCLTRDSLHESRALSVHSSLRSQIQPGTGKSHWGPHCVHRVASTSQQAPAPPLLIDEDGVPVARLEPKPRGQTERNQEVEPLGCKDGEQPVGPGCLTVLDDRLLLQGPAQPLLWTIRTHGRLAVRPLPENGVAMVKGLLADSVQSVQIWLKSPNGSESSVAINVRSTPARAHVVLSEVLANPHGPEPAQEWIELYNDGSRGTSLKGWRLRDSGAQTVLPDAWLAAGQYALLVREDFEPNAVFDPPPAPETNLIRLARLGKNGLSNAGEPLELTQSDGRRASMIPQPIKTKPGRSVVRRAGDHADEEPGTYVLSTKAPTPGAPN